MNKFLLILFFIIKLLVIVLVPVALLIFKRINIDKKIEKYIIIFEIIFISAIIVLYIIGFPYVTDSTFANVSNIKMLSESSEDALSNYRSNLSVSTGIKEIESSKTYSNHKGKDVYYYNSYDLPLTAKKINCSGDYDYFRYYSDIITSTSMLLSSYFEKEISPIEVLEKVVDAKLLKCGEPINQDDFFYMIYSKYGVNFKVINYNDLGNYILNGVPVLLETKGNGVMSCNQSYFVIYDINNNGDYLLLDPNNKTHTYICPDGSSGFGFALKANYNESTFSSAEVISDARRFIVIGGTR